MWGAEFLGKGSASSAENVFEFSTKNVEFYAFLLRKSRLRPGPETGTGWDLINRSTSLGDEDVNVKQTRELKI